MTEFGKSPDPLGLLDVILTMQTGSHDEAPGVLVTISYQPLIGIRLISVD
jgi:hypothetical protein